MKALIRGLVVGVSVLALGCTCPKITVPASDPTPPVLTWEVMDDVTQVVQTLTGNSTLTARWGQRISVRLIADDTGGVNTVSLSTTVEHSCNDAGVVTHVGPGLASPDVLTENAASDGTACSQLSRRVELDFRLGCSGGIFISGEADLMASATNFRNGTATATLTISVVP